MGHINRADVGRRPSSQDPCLILQWLFLQAPAAGQAQPGDSPAAGAATPEAEPAPAGGADPVRGGGATEIPGTVQTQGRVGVSGWADLPEDTLSLQADSCILAGS